MLHNLSLQELTSKVRFILLDRDSQGMQDNQSTQKNLHETIITAHSNRYTHTNDNFYKTLTLSELTDAELAKVALSILEQWPAGMAEALFLEKLKTLDAKKRVLFAIMLADYITQAPVDLATTQKTVLRYILDKEYD